MTISEFEAYAAAGTRRVNERLSRYAAVPDGDRLREAMRYSLLAGGKRMRPLLCLAGAQAVGGDPETVLPTACAIEMIHTFSLIHDDLPALDNDDLRRGMATSHKRFDEATAILAGDALHTLAFVTIARDQTGEPARVLRTLRRIGEACHAMVEGQVDDIAAEGNPNITAEQLRFIHARKTGALLLASVESGAILCGASDSQLMAIDIYGKQIGVAFQIVDDILDVTSDDATLGKPAGSDLKHDKATYPKLFGLDESRRLARVALGEAIGALDSFDLAAEPLRLFARYIVERNT